MGRRFVGNHRALFTVKEKRGGVGGGELFIILEQTPSIGDEISFFYSRHLTVVVSDSCRKRKKQEKRDRKMEKNIFC
jgi:hypothetical protein